MPWPAFRNLDRDWGLIPVAQLDSYKRLIFATFDRGAELGRIPGRHGGTSIFHRREGHRSESGPHRWVVDAGGGGKLWQRRIHIASTHASARELGIDTTTSETRKWNRGRQISCGMVILWLDLSAR
jgi:hypothetical protein